MYYGISLLKLPEEIRTDNFISRRDAEKKHFLPPALLDKGGQKMDVIIISAADLLHALGRAEVNLRVCRDELFSHTGKKTCFLSELCASNERSEWARDKGFGL